MPSLSNIPGFTALSTSSDPHAAWPAQASSYNVAGDGTTPLTNPTTSDGNKTGYCAPSTIYVGRGNNSGNVKGCNTIVCYGVWQGNGKQSTGWPNNYIRDVWNKADCLYVFTVNTSTGAITLSLEDKLMKINTNRTWGRSIQNSKPQYYTTPGRGSMVSQGYGLYGNSWSWNQTETGFNNYKFFRINTAGTDTLADEFNNEAYHNYQSWRISHCPKTSGSYDETHYFGVYNPNSSYPYQGELKYGSTSGTSYYKATAVSSLSGSQYYGADLYLSQPDGAAGGTGDISGIAWGGPNTQYRVIQGGCGGNGGSSDIKSITPTMSNWDTYRSILSYGSANFFQKSGSTYGTWRYCGDRKVRPMSNISTNIWDITPKSWTIPSTFTSGDNANVNAGICNDEWVSGINNRPFYYFNDSQEGMPFVKWEIDDTNGVKIIGSVMPPKFDYSGNTALGSNNNPETSNSTQHIFPIWNNSYDANPSWVVIVYWAGGGDQYSGGTTKGIPGKTQPVLRCYPWPTFTSQNIPL